MRFRAALGRSGRWLVGEDFSVADVDDAVREFSNVGLVGYEHDGVAVRVQIVEQRHDFIAGF